MIILLDIIYFFDVNTLLNKLHKSKFIKTATKINELVDRQCVLCVAMFLKEYMTTKYGLQY